MTYQTIQTLEELEALYPTRPGPAVLAADAEADRILPEYRTVIERSRFVVITTSGPNGIDVSPRGGEAGFVVVEDEHTLLLPDLSGNNRIDSMRNLLADPRVGLLFMVPGLGESLRAQGTVAIDRSPGLRRRFEDNGKVPHCVWVIRIQSIFVQGPRAAVRGRLWESTGRDAPRMRRLIDDVVVFLRKRVGRA